jgi:Ca2+-binding EF-hand superfamily protein
MFGRPKHGITQDSLRTQVFRNFGLEMSPQETARAFAFYDKEGKGIVPLGLFLERACDPDYTSKQWYQARDDEMIAAEKARKERGFDPPFLSDEEFPASLRKHKWTVDKIKKKIQLKIEQKTKRASDQYREAYAFFGSPSHGISKETFKGILDRLGIVLSAQELDNVFGKFDTDGSGMITFAELVGHVMGKDYTEKTWTMKRDEAIDVEDAAKASAQHTIPDWAKEKTPALSGVTSSWDMDKLREAVQTKIVERTKRPSDQYRAAYAMFGYPAKGITKRKLKQHLLALGMSISTEDVAKFFSLMDTKGAGLITFDQLMQGLMDADYQSPQWNELRDVELEKERVAAKHASFQPVETAWPVALAKNKWSIRDIEDAIRQKIVERTKRASDQYREAYAFFGSPTHGISPQMLHDKLQELGLIITKDELNVLFRRYDTDGSGRITFQELVSRLMPSDYTRVPWNILRDEEETRIALEKEYEWLSESPFASSALKAPKFARMTKKKSKPPHSPMTTSRSSRSRTSKPGGSAAAGVFVTGTGMTPRVTSSRPSARSSAASPLSRAARNVLP